MCSRVQATTNSFFLFLGSPPGFLFTVTVQQGSHSLSLTVRALALAKEEVPQSLLGVTIFSEKLFSHYGLLYFL